MLVIRLFRVGKRNQPSFKIVVTDKRNPTRAGRFIEELGFWNPLTKEKVFKKEKISYWLSVGAKTSVSVNNLLISEKIIEGKKLPKHKKPREKPSSAKATEGKEEKPTAEKPKEIKQELKTETPKKEEKPVPEKPKTPAKAPDLTP